MKKKEKKKIGNDLITPLILVLCVLPLFVRLAIYSCGYAEYDWYSQNDIQADFYAYYKSLFLEIIGITCVIVVLFRLALYKEKTKPVKFLIPLIVYMVGVFTSAIFSVNPEASWKGNFYSFESCMVLISYVIILFYGYQILEKQRDYETLWKGVLVISVLFSFVGFFQILGHDLMDFDFVKRLVMSEDNYYAYGDMIENTMSEHQVYLTLYNPNYAGVALVMLFSVVLNMCLTEKVKRRKVVYGVLAAILMLLTWFTYSRASFMIIILVSVVSFLVNLRKNRKQVLAAIGSIVCVVFVLIGIDVSMDSKFVERFFDSSREPLDYLLTDETGILVGYDGNDYILKYENEILMCCDQTGEILCQSAEGEEVVLPFANARAFMDLSQEPAVMVISLLETTLQFQREDGIYLYQNANGGLSPISEVEKVDLNGMESFASARGYIWSRTIPLLGRYALIGSGPDTFPEVFPQEDYGGKIVYADDPQRVIEKAHNDYLNKWVQTGGISVIALIIFYFMFLRIGGKALFRELKEKDTIEYRLTLGCYIASVSYMVLSLTNDSTLQTGPMFYLFAGIVLSVCVRKKLS